MADFINLRQARKSRDRARKKADADANAAKHGRSRSERTLTDAQQAKARTDLDGHKREP